MNFPSDVLYEKELSWLSFNERVLQEASNPKVPLIQRVRYLGITSNNTDEFYRVRVADVSRLAAFSRDAKQKEIYRKLLTDIQDKSRDLQNQYEAAYELVLRDLRKAKIYLVRESQLDENQAQKVSDIFREQVLPELSPMLIDKDHLLPEIQDGCIYLGVKIVNTDDGISYALLNIPSDRVPRFIKIPQLAGRRGHVFIVLENIIRHNLSQAFRGIFDIKTIEAYSFKVTRDAELELGEGIDQSLINRLAKSIKKRKQADAERFVYDADMPEDLLSLLRKGLGLTKYDSDMSGGRYQNSKDFMDFPNVGPAYLQFKSMSQLPQTLIEDTAGSIFEDIRNKDILLYYPYHSFDVVIDLLKTAAIDPQVKSISICLYRAASKSKVMDALINAKHNHKKVNVVVELHARFDEEANIAWARELTAERVNVTFGVPGLKVHSKLILIERQEKGSLKYYTHVGTGNFNEKTANLYTDFSLLTYDQIIGKDVAKVFDFISYNYRTYKFAKIAASPRNNRSHLTGLIQTEIENAMAGIPAMIDIKCNNLVDADIIHDLYRASDAGVRIRIICRGMFSMIAGQAGLSDNIEAISIVNRFLEHARVYIFYNGGKPGYYISSADLMTRNLDHRVEVTAPVEDPDLQQQIQDIFDIQWCDNVKARVLDKLQTNKFRQTHRGEKVCSQEAIHRYLLTGKLPTTVIRQRKRRQKDLAKSFNVGKLSKTAKSSKAK